MKLGFIGLGNMGAPMARNLLKAGHELTIYDVVQANVDTLVAQGEGRVTAVTSPAAILSNGAEAIITMLPAAQHVKTVYLGENGILTTAVKGIILIDSSTIDPMSAREVAAAASSKGALMLDAPVSGGTGGAEAATLTFMVGGDEQQYLRFKDILSCMGKNIVYCGGSGNGQVAKVVNNMLLGISMIGTAEAMSLGVSLGMDPKTLAGIINTSSGRCWSSDTYNPFPGVLENVPSSRGYTGGFGADLMLKDLGLATEAAKSAKQPVPLGGLAQQMYQTLSLQGKGHLDFSAIIQLFQKQSIDRM
jgi:3-hydroxyisobutyrate dehydrogenase